MNQLQKYHLTDEQWVKIEPIITEKIGDWGGANANDNRLFVDACLYIVRTNTAWHKLPLEYGKYKAINRRFNRWRNQHIWDDILVILLKFPEFEWLLIDNEQQNSKHELPKFTMKLMKMISPSRALLGQIQKQIANSLSYLE